MFASTRSTIVTITDDFPSFSKMTIIKIIGKMTAKMIWREMICLTIGDLCFVKNISNSGGKKLATGNQHTGMEERLMILIKR